MRTNWLNDLKVYWKSSFNLVNLIEMDVNLGKKVLKNWKFIWTRWNYGHIKS
jgi:hypothetical protein